MSYLRSLRWQGVAAFVMTLVAAAIGGVALTGAARWEFVALVLTIGALSVWLLVRGAASIQESIDSLTRAADRIAGGELTHRVFAPATEETRQLAAAFNRMAGVLQETVEDMSRERARLAALVDAIGDGVVLIDRPGNIELANSAARRLLRLSVLGGRLREGDLLDLAEQARTKRMRAQDDVELLPGPRYVSAIAIPVDDGRVLLTVHDLTAVRQLDVTRREFVSNVSHELRNPLAAMAALVETLESGAIADPEAAPDFVRRLHVEIVHMTALVADLLTLSRLEGGQQDPGENRAEVQRVLLEAREVLLRKRGDQESAEVRVEVSVPADAAVSPLRLRQIVDNLLENSLRFTPADGLVTMRAVPEDGMVRIEVTDTGEGIAPEHLPHIFERFYKADPSRHDPGTGLGLSIVKHIVETYRGSIAVNSEVGAGTTVTVRLPAAA